LAPCDHEWKISDRRATFRESIRRTVAHIKAMLGDLAPDPWQQSPRDVAHDTDSWRLAIMNGNLGTALDVSRIDLN
jgi:hypothetical protein